MHCLTLATALWTGGLSLPALASAAEPAAVVAIEVPVAKIASTLLLDVASAGSRLIAVGQRGHIIYSDDQGQTWVQAKVPTRALLTAVFFVDAMHGWAVGHDAQILASTDGGATWTLQFEDPERESPLIDVWFENLEHGIASGAYGTLLETTDGGKSWEDIGDLLDNEDGVHLNSIIQVKDGGLLIAGEMGLIFRSFDNGQSWETVEPPYEGSLFGALPLNQSRSLLVFGLRGSLFRSTDFGDSWQQITLPGSGSEPFNFGLAGASALPDGSIVLVGNGGSVAVSHDDGLSFSVVNAPDRQPISSVVAGPDGQLLTVGQGGVQLIQPPLPATAEQMESAQ
ncbi:hypothetical protein ISX93_15480 [Pseudomonas sp. N040]|nr:hypothetical protein [Pseudomonas sp. N040]MBW7015111.1 hypothetical protein [Pseudomonas sp. N040]